MAEPTLTMTSSAMAAATRAHRGNRRFCAVCGLRLLVCTAMSLSTFSSISRIGWLCPAPAGSTSATSSSTSCSNSCCNASLILRSAIFCMISFELRYSSHMRTVSLFDFILQCSARKRQIVSDAVSGDSQLLADFFIIQLTEVFHLQQISAASRSSCEVAAQSRIRSSSTR